MIQYKGFGAAEGQALGKAVLLVPENCEICKAERAAEEMGREKDKLHCAREECEKELGEICQKTVQSLGEKEADIFRAYIEIVRDNYFFSQVVKRMEAQQCNIEYALKEEKEAVVRSMEAIEDEYIRERAADIEYVCTQLINRITGVKACVSKEHVREENYIVVACDLSPADTMLLDKRYLKGFVTEKGGKTSHTVILARSLGIPAVIAAKGITGQVAEGQNLYIDGGTGEVLLEPGEAFVLQFEKSQSLLESRKEELKKAALTEGITADGCKIKICANTGDPESLQKLDADLCDGIGLYRTEFLYMNHSQYPTQEEQFQAYRAAVEAMKGKKVVFRTLDIGGDKQLDYMQLDPEENPFLGYRAIRICLGRKEMFITQLKAILQASAYGNAAIMFPMIVNLEEFREAREAVVEAMKDLDAQDIPYDSRIKIGVMIETPAAVLISDKLAREADFFSIGTNDLLQYTTAADRMNEKVQYLYDECNLALLRAIRMVIHNAHKEGITVSICGEAAADAKLLSLWAAMGIDKLSMAQTQVVRTKTLLRSISGKDREEYCESILCSDTMEQVRERIG